MVWLKQNPIMAFGGGLALLVVLVLLFGADTVGGWIEAVWGKATEE